MTEREHDRVKVSVLVAVPPDDAFAVFTQEIDRWWGDLLTSLREHAGDRAGEPERSG
jgi:uncharacterized protein YndB with AHSA1/START domain